MSAAVLRTPADQALRLRRFRLAASTYAAGAGLAAVAWVMGKLPLEALGAAALGFLATNLVLFAIIRSGLNLRFRDPSLTRVQIVAGITALMYVVYHMDEGRSVALFGCFVIFLFGIFHLNARQFIGVMLYTLAAHAIVILLLLHFRPAAVSDLPGELLSWLGLAGFLPLFIVIGARIRQTLRNMRAAQARFRALTEMTSDFYWESDSRHRLTERGAPGHPSNHSIMFPAGPRIGQCRWDVPSLSPGEDGWRAHRAELDAHRPFRGFEHSRLGPDGTEWHVSISGDPVFDARGRFCGYRGVGTDVTQRKRTEQALRDNAESFRVFADSVPAMSASWDESLCCRFANRHYAEFFGLGLGNPLGRSVRELAGEAVYAQVAPHFAQVMQGTPATYQRTHARAAGPCRYLEIRLLPQFGADRHVVGCFEVATDITEHKLTEERILRMANHDSLTGLPNKLQFQERLEEVIARARQASGHFALLYIDLDRFKPVNDEHGHAAGDRLLVEVALRIRGQVRESDTVARVGGDEFTVILPGISDRVRAEIVGRKISAALTRSFELGETDARVTIGGSVGIALYPSDGGDAASLLKAADAAMYRAKPGWTPA